MPDVARRRRVGWGEVVAMAATVIRERGIEALTTQELAERLNTDVADVTYWFTDRGDLLSAVIKVRQERFLELAWARLAEERSHAGKLRALIELAVAVRSAVYLIELLKLSLRDSSAREVRERIEEPYRDLVETVVRAGVAAGEFDDVPVDLAASTLLALITSLSVQATLGDPAVEGERMLETSIAAAEALLGASLTRA